jgi:hypothetical protein
MTEPHMIDNYISVVFVIVVNHVGFMLQEVCKTLPISECL